MKGKTVVAGFVVLLLAGVSMAQLMMRTAVYIEPQGGFETYIAAAIEKKHVPVDVVGDRTKAMYVLRAAPIETKSESSGSKIARCLFLYCAGIEDSAHVSVQLVEVSSTKILWAYTVGKQHGGGHNQQSMAEAIAKHFRQFLEKK